MSTAHPHDEMHLAHHFETPEQQYESSKLGMWIFLATEVLLFGGLFCAYSVYRSNHPEIFIYAHQFLDKVLGGINTIVLICSSFTMAWAVRAAQLGQKRKLVTLLALTIICAFGFLGIKGIEYEHKWKHGLLWGKRYHPETHEVVGAQPSGQARPAAPTQAPTPGSGGVVVADAKNPDKPLLPLAAEGPKGLSQGKVLRPLQGEAEPVPKNVQIFFSIYFIMTGLHGLHVIAGIVVISWILRRSLRGEFGPNYFAPVDNAGLYWHLVDMIWIYLFPLLYLIH